VGIWTDEPEAVAVEIEAAADQAIAAAASVQALSAAL
jgi:hypothetical protein